MFKFKKNVYCYNFKNYVEKYFSKNVKTSVFILETNLIEI